MYIDSSIILVDIVDESDCFLVSVFTCLLMATSFNCEKSDTNLFCKILLAFCDGFILASKLI